MRTIGTQAKGIRTPIIKDGDDLVSIVVDSIEKASKAENFELGNRDVVAVTEGVLARAQGNYATIDEISIDVERKFGKDAEIGVVFPIMSRNRFSVLLEGIAKRAKKVYVQLSYPADEVGNELLTQDQIIEKDVNPYSDHFNEKEFREVFGYETKHRFTGVDYIEYYKSLSSNIEVVFSNIPTHILKYTDNVIFADVHTRNRTKAALKKANVQKVYGLADILNVPVDGGNGYNPDYGLLGSNRASDSGVKLFPRDCDEFIANLAKALKKRFGKDIEAMVYGDGAFKDPQGGIWEFADPVVSPAYTKGLEGTPNEVKLKYLADNQLAHLKGEELNAAMRAYISKAEHDTMASQGTTPRQITDLIGSLSDLVSGSGDKGTPVILIQGYFDNFADE